MICVGFRKEGGGHAGPIIVRPTDRGPSDAFVRLNANVRVREEALVGRRIASGSSPKESMISAKPLPHVSTYLYPHFPLA